MADTQTRWIVREPIHSELTTSLPDIPPLLLQLLYNRGISDSAQIAAFLSGDYASQQPFAMKGMDRAVGRIRQAIRKGESIAVYGDFDADGVTATVLLVSTLQALGARARPYIPDRLDEAYGVNEPALDQLASEGVKLVITVDCGIRAVEQVAYGNYLGLEIIVTDHHTPPPTSNLPPALAIINPRQEGCPYPFKRLAGVGVAHKLADALLRAARSTSSREDSVLQSESLLDLVAIGTVADVVPLLDENRALVQQGLRLINSGCARPGVRAVMAQAGIRQGEVDAERIGFGIAPRLNAAGRLESAMHSYDLLASGSAEEAIHLAEGLNALNRERQEMTRGLFERADAEILGGLDEPLCIVAGGNYHPGLIGLVASRLTDAHNRPSIVINVGKDTSRGSARSITGFHVTHALDECAGLLIRHGGHEMAAGFEVHNCNLGELVDRLHEIGRRELTEEDLTRKLFIDAELPSHDITFETLDLVNLLAPFGTDNEMPTFTTPGLRIREHRVVGSGHLKMTLSDGRVVWDAIAFRQGDRVSEGVPDVVDVAYTLGRHTWDGSTNLQLTVKDFRAAVSQASGQRLL